MYQVGGMVGRPWCTCSLIAVIGIFILLVARDADGAKKKGSEILNASMCILLALILGIGYSFCLLNPNTQKFTGTFDYEQHASGVLPPIPMTDAYGFLDDLGDGHVFYLDAISKKEMFPETLEKGKQYTVIYESRTDIILHIE